MSNHFHLVVETPNANLGTVMRWLLSCYAIRVGDGIGTSLFVRLKDLTAPIKVLPKPSREEML